MLGFVTGAALPCRRRRVPSVCATRAALNADASIAGAKPVGDRLLVRVSTPAAETAGGLILAPEANKRPKNGVVIAVPDAPRATTADNLQVGDHVMWSNDYVADVVEDGEERIVTVRAGNVSAKW